MRSIARPASMMPPAPSRGLMDLLSRGEQTLTRVDSSIQRTESAAQRAQQLSQKSPATILLAVSVVAAIGVGAWYLSKQPEVARLL